MDLRFWIVVIFVAAVCFVVYATSDHLTAGPERELNATSLFDLTSYVGAVGAGLGHIRVRFDERLPFPLKVPAGTVFESRSDAVQNMIAICDVVVQFPQFATRASLLGDTTMEVLVPAACLEMQKRAPTGNDTFLAVDPAHARLRDDLKRIVAQLNRETPDSDHLHVPLGFDSRTVTRKELRRNRVFQFAIWTLTDNPNRNGFVGITSQQRGPQGGPDWRELRMIKRLLQRAGIQTSDYRAFA